MASEAIARLDRRIARTGQTVTLRRGATTRTMRAFVRGFKVAELVGNVVQGDRLIVLSPTGLAEPFLTATPKRGDEVLFEGRPASVQSSESVMLDDVLVRMNVQVRG